MRKAVQVMVAVGCLTASGISDATLLSRLGGAAAYDDVLDITWVTNAGLSNEQLGGTLNWQQHVDWAADLDYLGFDDGGKSFLL